MHARQLTYNADTFPGPGDRSDNEAKKKEKKRKKKGKRVRGRKSGKNGERIRPPYLNEY